MLGRLLEHPFHPPTTHFALALPCTATLWDAVSLMHTGSMWADLAFWTIVAGLLAAGLALLTGMWDACRYIWMEDSVSPRASDLLLRHIILMLSGEIAFGISLWLRIQQSHPLEYSTSTEEMIVSAVGTVALLVGGWHGGEMVYTERTGVLQ